MATPAEQRGVLHACIAQLSSGTRTLNGPTRNDLAGTTAAHVAELQRLQQLSSALLQSMGGEVLSQGGASALNNSNGSAAGAAVASPPVALACDNTNSQQHAPHSTAAAAGQQGTDAGTRPGHWLDLTFPVSPCASGDQQPAAPAPAPAPATAGTRSKASCSPRRPAAAQHGSTKRQVLEALGDGGAGSLSSGPRRDSLLAPDAFAAPPALKKLRVRSSTHSKPQAQAGTLCSPRASHHHGQSQQVPQGVAASDPEASAAAQVLMGWSQKAQQHQEEGKDSSHQLQQPASASPVVKPGPTPAPAAGALAALHSSHARQHSTAPAAMPPPVHQQQQQRPGDFTTALMTAFMAGYAQRVAEERPGGGGGAAAAAAAMPGWSPLTGGTLNALPQSPPLVMAGGGQLSAALNQQQHGLVTGSSKSHSAAPHQPIAQQQQLPAAAHSPSDGGHHSPAAPAPSTPGSDGKHFWREIEERIPLETQAALRAAWAREHRMAVQCSHKDRAPVTGLLSYDAAAAEFRITTPDGNTHRPVDFEALAGKPGCHNWQMSITLPGYFLSPAPTKTPKALGAQQQQQQQAAPVTTKLRAVQLGHFARICGIDTSKKRGRSCGAFV